jgi:hypothetical protein
MFHVAFRAAMKSVSVSGFAALAKHTEGTNITPSGGLEFIGNTRISAGERFLT